MSVLLLSATSAHAVPLSLSSEIYLTNIHITNLNSLAITSKNIDYNVNNTSARAVASDNMSSLNNAKVAYRGSVDDTSTSGSAYSFASLDYLTQPDSLFMGSSFAMLSTVMVNDHGFAESIAGFAEQIWFTALTPADVTFSFDYSSKDFGLNSGLNGLNFSESGVSFNIANFNDGIYLGGMTDGVIHSGTLTATQHFDEGETGWFALNAAADNGLYMQPAPVPEPSSIILLVAGFAGIVILRLRRAGSLGLDKAREN